MSRVVRTIAEHRLLSVGDRVLVAVSGGPDSTAMLHALVHLQARLGVAVEAACIDHGLRPESSDEAAMVAERCQALGVVCLVERVDVRAARGRNVSWQQAARVARLAALEALAGRRGCGVLALGHTADDQAETILFRIVRGTGLRGLAGIPYRRGRFIRPLLDVGRADVLAYVRRRRLPFVEDPSNQDRRFTRARVRHEWLPFLRTENPRVAEALLRLAAEVRGVPDFPPEASSPADTSAGSVAPTVGSLGLSRRVAETVARLQRAAAGTRRVSVRGGELEVAYGRVRFHERRGRADNVVVNTLPVAVAAPGRYRLSTPSTEAPAVEVMVGEGAPRAPGGAVLFDASAVGWPLTLRAPRPGDRLRPRGGRGTRKLSDMFVDAKVSRFLRADLPVLVAADGEILFVPGLRPSARGAPTPATRHWIAVRGIAVRATDASSAGRTEAANSPELR